MTIINRAATAAAICAAILLTGTACTSNGDDGDSGGRKTSASPTASAKSAADDAVQHVDGETVTEAPKVDGKKVIASFANGQFGRAIPFEGGLRKGTLGIALNCEGKGTVTVEVAALGLSFSERCADDEVASTYNESEVIAAYPDAFVHVTGTSGVRWAISAGQ